MPNLQSEPPPHPSNAEELSDRSSPTGAERGAPAMGAKSEPQRLTGLDFLRGVAAFAVVALHADEGMTIAPLGWQELLDVAAFAVPFFLAASFFLSVGKLTTDHRSPQWRKRLMRLLIPYGIWSGFYVAYDLLRAVVKYQPEALKELLEQLPAIIFLGRAGFHLYFIPLLLTGTGLLAILLPGLRQRWQLSSRIGWLIGSLFVYQAYRSATAGTAFNLLADEHSGIFVILSVLGFGIRCLPYVAFAFLLSHSWIRSQLHIFSAKSVIFLLLLFMVLSFVPVASPWQAAHELFLGYSALLLALALSYVIPVQPWLTHLGQCSFGIYLMHLFWVELLWSGLKRLGLPSEPLPLVLPLAVAMTGFGISWWLTARLMRHPRLAKLLFGVASP